MPIMKQTTTSPKSRVHPRFQIVDYSALLSQKTLLSFPPNLLGAVNGSYVEFYDESVCEADEYDHVVMKEYSEDLNTAVIFVSILFPSTLVVFLTWVL